MATIQHAKIPEEIQKAFSRGEYGQVIPQLRPIAEAGDAEAQYLLACALDNGDRSEESLNWYERAADAGHAKAQEALGSIHAYGAYGTRDAKRGVALLEAALSNGYEPAHTLADRIAAFYRDGVGVEQDWGRAYALFRRAIKDGVWGFAYSYLDAAWSEFWGLGTERNESRAAATYSEFLELRTCHDQSGANLALAAMHMLGVGVDRDPAAVIEHLKKAAHLRPFANFLLAHCYRSGYGVAEDPARANELLEAANAKLERPIDPGYVALEVVAERIWAAMNAAWLGNARAQFEMANFSMTHEKNPSAYVHTRELNRWLRIAAHNGEARAQLRFGELFLYWKGSQVPPDEKVGLSWVRRAADQGLPEATEELARRSPEPMAALREQLAQIFGFPKYPSDIGGLVLELGSSAVFVRAVDEDSAPKVRVHVVAIDKVEQFTPALAEYMAAHSELGSFVPHRDKAQIHYVHELPAAPLDPEALKTAVVTLANLCEDMFDELQRLTGGRRFVLPGETAA